MSTFAAVSISAVAFDQTMNGAYSLLSPINDILYYFFPKLGTYFSGGIEISRKSNPFYDGSIVFADRTLIWEQIDRLSDLVGLQGKVTVFESSAPYFSSYGGHSFFSDHGYSFMCPVLQMPKSCLVRPANLGTFGAEKDESMLQMEMETIRYSDRETSFLILRSLAQINTNDSMFKVIVRVMMVAGLVLLQVNPLTWPLALLMLNAAVIGYFIVNYFIQSKLDCEAVKYLMKITPTKEHAVSAALSVLRKMRAQNLERKEHGWLNNLLIDSQGNERFNFTAPSLTSRIEKVKELYRELEQARVQNEAAVRCPESPDPMPIQTEEALYMGR